MFTLKYSVFQADGQGNVDDLDSNGKKNLLVDGTETLMVLFFCELYNCTLDVAHGLLEIHVLFQNE